MRRQDREAMREKSQEGRRADRDEAAPEFEQGKKREQTRGGSTPSEQQQSPQHPSGRLPLPD
jgi:hypothetical protein